MHDPKDALAVVPWYWRDWRASTARAVLSPLGRYAYRELLDAHWAEPDATVPDDDVRLAALSGLTLDEWQSVRGQVLEWIPPHPSLPGRRQNPRAATEHARASQYREACRKGGRNRAAALSPDARSKQAKQASDARWASSTKHSDPRSCVDPACTPSPSPSPSPSPFPPPYARARETDPESAPGESPGAGEWSDLAGRLADALEEDLAATARVVADLKSHRVDPAWIRERIAAIDGPAGAYAWKRDALAAWREAHPSAGSPRNGHTYPDHGPRAPLPGSSGYETRLREQLAHLEARTSAGEVLGPRDQRARDELRARFATPSDGNGTIQA